MTLLISNGIYLQKENQKNKHFISIKFIGKCANYFIFLRVGNNIIQKLIINELKTTNIVVVKY